MPKAFSNAEKALIRTHLMQAGLARFAKAGVRNTRIDDICQDAGIAKGSFYAFFATKEDLFMTIANERDVMHKADMIALLAEKHASPRQMAVEFFNFMMERIETDPILAIVRDTGEIAHLMRRISPEKLMENTRRDRAFMVEVSEIFQNRYGLKYADKQTLEGLLTIMLSVSLQKQHLIVADAYLPTIDLVRDLYLSRLLKGPVSD